MFLFGHAHKQAQRRKGKIMTAKISMESPVGFLRCEDAARFLGVSVRTLAQWQAERRIPFAKVSHRVVLFKVSDLEKCMDRLTIKAAGG
jgi:excisionase family DNA binding protein